LEVLGLITYRPYLITKTIVAKPISTFWEQFILTNGDLCDTLPISKALMFAKFAMMELTLIMMNLSKMVFVKIAIIGLNVIRVMLRDGWHSVALKMGNSRFFAHLVIRCFSIILSSNPNGAIE